MYISPIQSCHTRFLKWIFQEKGITASIQKYYELIGKGEAVIAEEIVEACVFPLSSAMDLKLFVNKYYMEHGRVNGEGRTSEHMLETMTRSVQYNRLKEVYMVKALEAHTDANRVKGLPLYSTDALAQEYEEQGKGLGVQTPELKKLRKATC
jgi:hypothetical protein